jgi:Domain of unknown function (DUF1707)
MTNPFDQPHIRVGDAERDDAVAELARAHAEGRLTYAELDERTGRALAARTRGDLQAVLADLVPAPLGGLGPGVVATRPLGAGNSWDDPLVIEARWSEEVRLGRWVVPPFLEVHPAVSSVKLNFVDAITSSPVIDIVIVGGAGETRIVVPLGWGAELSRLTRGLGSAKSSVVERAESGRPQLVIRGNIALGGLRVRHPGHFDAWQQRRGLARQGRR